MSRTFSCRDDAVGDAFTVTEFANAGAAVAASAVATSASRVFLRMFGSCAVTPPGDSRSGCDGGRRDEEQCGDVHPGRRQRVVRVVRDRRLMHDAWVA